MNTEIKQDLKINGSGKSSGGYYNNIVINGSGEINGNIDCNYFKVNGSATVKGTAKSNDSKISGTATIEGNHESDELKVNGTAEIKGDAVIKLLKVNGTLDITGKLNGEETKIKGAIKIGSDCNLDKFDSKGSFSIAGLLNADEIDAEIYGPCKVNEIGGSKINIRQGHSFGLRKLLSSIFAFFNIKDNLIVDNIEGDDIYLEYTHAKIVRGNNVTLGDGCEIELVEYKNNFQNNGDSKVNESKMNNM